MSARLTSHCQAAHPVEQLADPGTPLRDAEVVHASTPFVVNDGYVGRRQGMPALGGTVTQAATA